MAHKKRINSNIPKYVFSISNKDDMLFWSKGSKQEYFSQPTDLVRSSGLIREGKEGIITVPKYLENQMLARYGITAGAYSERNLDFCHFIQMKNSVNFEFILKGSISFKTDNQTFKINAGDTLIIPNGCSGYLRVLSDNTKIFWINVNPKSTIGKAIGKEVSVSKFSSFDAIISIFKLYKNEIYNRNDLQILDDYACTLYHLLMLDLKNCQKSSKLERLMQIINDVQAKPSIPISSGVVAKKLKMTVYDLDKLMIARFGERFAKYILSIRMKEAINLLRSGHSCEEVAKEVGYRSQFSFSHAFKAFYNKNPSKI